MVTNEMTKEKEAIELKKELTWGWKTPSDCIIETMKRLAKERPSTGERQKYIMQGKVPVPITVKVAKLTVKEILEMDNKVRSEAPKVFGLRQMKQYPVINDEYSPATKKATFKRLVGGEIIMEPNKMPQAIPIYEECAGFDPAENLTALNAEVDAECKKLYPLTKATKEDRKAIRNSLIQRKDLELAEKPEVEEDKE